MWQLARRTSREVGEAKINVWESAQELIKQIQEKQNSRIKSQDALIADMRRRLTALEAQNTHFHHQETTVTKEVTKAPQEAHTDKSKDSDEGIKSGKVILFFILILVIIGLLQSA